MSRATTSLIPYLIDQLTPARIMLIAVLLLLPGLFAPFYADDYFHLLLLADHPLLQRGGDGSLFGLFSFVDNTAGHRQQMLRYGVLPWWTADDFYFRFWRPVAEATHWLDYQILPGVAWFAHLHSLGWFLLLLVVIQRLAAQLASTNTVLIIMLAIFAWDGQHVATINWVANRAALIAAVLAFSALYQHCRWRSGEQRFPLLALVLYGYALLASEMAIAITVYLFFYALLLDRQGSRKGLLAIMPYALVTLVYLWFYQQQGFGANTSSDFYVSPLTEPLHFLRVSGERFLAYIAAAWLPMPAGLMWIGGETYPWLRAWVVGTGAIVTVLVVVGLGRSLMANRQLAFWLCSATFSVVTVCAAMPQDRLALFQSVGMAFVIAILVEQGFRGGISGREGQCRRWFAYALIVVHLLLSPLHLLAGGLLMRHDATSALRQALHFSADVSLADKHVIVLSMPLGLSVAMVGTRVANDAELPLSFLPLASQEGHFSVTRLDERNYRIQRDIGFVSGFETQFRSLDRAPFSVGQQFNLPAAVITIEALDQNGRPQTIALRLTEPVSSYLLYGFPEAE